MEGPSSRERSDKARARRSLNQKNENEEEKWKWKWAPILAYSVRTFTTPTRLEDETA